MGRWDGGETFGEPTLEGGADFEMSFGGGGIMDPTACSWGVVVPELCCDLLLLREFGFV
jgi:hypothetical protein